MRLRTAHKRRARRIAKGRRRFTAQEGWREWLNRTGLIEQFKMAPFQESMLEGFLKEAERRVLRWRDGGDYHHPPLVHIVPLNPERKDSYANTDD